MGKLLGDRPVIAHDRVRFVGEPVAAVAAETENIAETAADLIDVEYRRLPAVFDLEESMKSEPPTIIHPSMGHYSRAELPIKIIALEKEMPNVFTHLKIRKGDVEKGFKQADLVIENRFTYQG